MASTTRAHTTSNSPPAIMPSRLHHLSLLFLALSLSLAHLSHAAPARQDAPPPVLPGLGGLEGAAEELGDIGDLEDVASSGDVSGLEDTLENGDLGDFSGLAELAQETMANIDPEKAQEDLKGLNEKAKSIAAGEGSNEEKVEKIAEEVEGGLKKTAGIENKAKKDGKDEKSCFPGGAKVETEDGARVRMEDLRVGDRVRVAAGGTKAAFSEVFLFTHADAAYASASFVRVSAGGRALTAAAGHFVYKTDGGRPEAVAVEGLRVGESVLLNGAEVEVEKVERVRGKGLFNPQTVHGDIVVDGFLATTYTSAVRPSVAHALLAPVRAAYLKGGIDVSRAFEVCAGYFR